MSIFPDPPEWTDYDEREAREFLAEQAERDLANRCECYEPATMEYGPVPCARCLADELADGAA